MARNDPIFARVDISLLFDPRYRRLNQASKAFYLACWLTSVEARSELLPPQFDLKAIADRSGGDTRTNKTALEKCCTHGLLEQTPQGLIRVIGTRANHPKLNWNEYAPSSPYGADVGLKREENTIQYHTITREEAQAPPPEPTAKNPKNWRPADKRPGPDEGKAFDVGIDRFLRKAGTGDTYEPAKSPSRELIEQEARELEGLIDKWGATEVLRKMVGVEFKSGDIVSQHLNDSDLILKCSAYAEAWKKTNPNNSDSSGVFINRFKKELENRAAA